jgi:hypothetical protein
LSVSFLIPIGENKILADCSSVYAVKQMHEQMHMKEWWILLQDNLHRICCKDRLQSAVVNIEVSWPFIRFKKLNFFAD